MKKVNLNYNSDIVDEFNSVNAQYYVFEGADSYKLILLNKLSQLKLESEGKLLGVKSVIHTADYLNFEHVSVISKSKAVLKPQFNYISFDFTDTSKPGSKITDYKEKEEEIFEKAESKIYIFKDYIVALGNTSGIKNSIALLTELTGMGICPFIIPETKMLYLANYFDSIHSVTLDRIKHKYIKKITIQGNAVDISDLVDFPGYDIVSITGKFHTDFAERKIKIHRNGKITFNKHKDCPLFIRELQNGWDWINNSEISAITEREGAVNE